MARPIKEGLDYFPLNVVLNSKFEIIEARFGIKGFAVIVKLFQHIYGTKGYYCEWDEDVLFVFAKRIGVGANSVSEILNTAIKKGIFDEEMEVINNIDNFDFDIPFIGGGNISKGIISLEVPYVNKIVALNQTDLEVLKESLISLKTK